MSCLQDFYTMQLAYLIDVAFSLITLSFLEIILGIDNLVFVALASSRLPPKQQAKARRLGLLFAWVTRLLLLAFALYLSKLMTPLFYIDTFAVSCRDIFLFGGGLFLIAKTIQELHAMLDDINTEQAERTYSQFWLVVMQIGLLDILFSLDSVITAVGMTQHFWVMASAITIAIITMIMASEPLNALINRHPTLKMLAFSFLFLIGTVLIADGLHFHIPRSYIYVAIAFAIFVECLNFLYKKRSK